jgi:CMP/dCMP kinase
VGRVIAVDGPSASGKSTVARKVAGSLGWLYVDSGSLYRAMAWKALRDGVDSKDTGAVEQMVRGVKMDFFTADGAVVYRIDGVNPGDAIRTQAVNDVVSHVAAVPLVREYVVRWLRGMAQIGDLVMEGRDIGTAVFPGAEWKFYLNASAEERARRRHVEMEQKGIGEDFDAVQKSLKKRDSIDSTRKADPLRVAEGAQIIDSTGMAADQVAAFILSKVAEDLKK